MSVLDKKRILLGVTGGIAAYKSAELVRRLMDVGVEVRVVMTRSACDFVTPLTFQALSGHPVPAGRKDTATETGMAHIELARWADAILIAPASADFIAKLAYGLADDLLSTICVAATAPLLVAPAMNQAMWRNAATQANVATLKNRGARILGPAAGSQACGEEGPGRMLEPEALLECLAQVFQTGLLAGRQVLVTAGPTREAIDPVRYISNRSSGRMGYALASAAAEAGARVCLISGPTSMKPPQVAEFVQTSSAADMHAAVLTRAGSADIFIAAAAVADYRVARPAARKLKKSADGLILSLERTPDILAEVTCLPAPPFTVGFAAETENLADNAREKLHAKRLNLVVANLVGGELGFDSEENAVTVFWPGGEQVLDRAPKERIARELISIIARQYRAQYSAQDRQSTHRR
jgi:phosphopantothenoylcysteine decarboxylase/phosphopantothenate--cysteine ligase